MRIRIQAAALAGVLIACGGDDGNPLGPQTNTCVGTCIVVTNATDFTVNTVLYAACVDADWGPNRLGGGRLNPGSSRGWPVSPGCYDIRVSAPSGGGTYMVTHIGNEIAAGETYTFLYQEVPPP